MELEKLADDFLEGDARSEYFAERSKAQQERLEAHRKADAEHAAAVRAANELYSQRIKAAAFAGIKAQIATEENSTDERDAQGSIEGNRR